jgi:hypothetical protein
VPESRAPGLGLVLLGKLQQNAPRQRIDVPREPAALLSFGFSVGHPNQARRQSIVPVCFAQPLPNFVRDAQEKFCEVAIGRRALIYSGGFNSLASHPAFSDFMGSVATICCRRWLHLPHSNQQRSYPGGPGMIRAKCVRVPHLAQGGRSRAVSDGPDDEDD